MKILGKGDARNRQNNPVAVAERAHHEEGCDDQEANVSFFCTGFKHSHDPNQERPATNAESDATSSSVKSTRGERTEPAGLPITFSPALIMATAYPLRRSRIAR